MSRVLTLLALSAALFSPAALARDAAANFTLRDINGQSVSLSDYKGKVVLVNFWATWCAPCQVEMPHLQQLQTDLSDKGFTVLSISVDDARTSSQVKPLIKRNGYSFPVLLDKETSVVSQYNPAKSVPYTVMIDKQQRIANVHTSYSPGDEVAMRQEIEALIAEAGN